MNIQSIKNTDSYNFDIKTLKPSINSDDDYVLLRRQIEQEFKESNDVLLSKIDKYQKRLKVYSNQRRDDDAVGDTLLFTTMQTVIASLYDDQLISEWRGQNDGDMQLEEAINHLSEYDFRATHKNVLDYFWIWDTGFFGHSIVYMTDFDREKKHPVPDLQNPMLFYRDPKAVMVNGYPWNGRNACRNFGRWIELSKPQMQKNPEYFNLDRIKPEKSKSDEIDKARQSYQDAQGLTYQNSQTSGDNQLYPLLEWCTHWQGKKVLVTLANDKKTVVRIHEFKTKANGSGTLKPSERWPVVDRLMYPMSHDWDGVSIPDIVEDKQRMRAVLKNLAIKSAKADLYPMYIFDKNRIKNDVSLGFGYNKFIGVDTLNGQPVSNVLSPIQKAQFNVAVHQYIMEDLASEGEKATATPQMQQGNLNQQKRLATELNMVDRNVGTRYGLTAKVFGWSERDYHMEWFRGYKDHFADYIDKKVLRLNSPWGAKFRTLTKENFMFSEDPDVFIESRYVRDQKREMQRQNFTGYLSLAAQVPGANIRYGVKKLGRLISLEKDELDVLIPMTIDERIAERENELLSKNKPVLVNANDDHMAHLEKHREAADTPATYAHKRAHERAIELYKANPNLLPQFAEQQAQQQAQQEGSMQSMAKLMPGGASDVGQQKALPAPSA